jgi:hypothetical protein
MSTLVIALTVVLGATSAVVATTRFVRAWRRARGVRLITCPENHRPAAVTLDAVDAGLAAAVNERAFHLSSCTRWPEKRDCNQACLSQIAEAPDGCLVRARVAAWYRGKKCSLCQKSIEPTSWIDHQPALLSPGNMTVLWDEVPVEYLPDVFNTHRPVCWDCHVAESFRREFPDTVVDREWDIYRERFLH